MRNNINEHTVTELSQRINSYYTTFQSDKFCKEIIPSLDDLGLYERLDLITLKLYKYLPKEFSEAVDILLNSLGDEIVADKVDLDGIDLSSNNGFIIISLTNYISSYGLDYFELSMKALYEMTKRFSAEGAVRHFIIKYPERCYELFRKWVKDENVHIRRLVSEGLRPRLPWAIRLQNFVKDPAPVLEFLEALKDDRELYVRRSVANNLNDIAKDHPDIVVELLQSWNPKASKEMEWLTKHALRTLVKQGNIGALELLGYKKNPEIKVRNLELNSDVKLGEFLEFSFDIISESDNDQKLVIDYIIFHKKANGLQTPKVFKLKNVKLKSSENIRIFKRHGIKKINTRKYYEGKHRVVIQVNGKEFLSGEFNLSF